MQHTSTENQKFSTVSKLSVLDVKFQVKRDIIVKGVLHKDIKRRLNQEFGYSLMFYHKSRRESEFYTTKSVLIEKNERRMQLSEVGLHYQRKLIIIK